MAQSEWRALVLDRMHVSVGIQSKDLYGFARSQLKGIWELRKEITPHGKIVMSKDDFTTRISIYPGKNRMIAGLEVGSTKSKHRYFRLALHPQNFQAAEFEDLQLMLLSFLDVFNYHKLHQTGRVSYVEWAADSLSHAPSTFIPFRAYCNSSWIYPGGGTIYLGSPTGGLFHRIYDKAKQLLENSKPVSWQTQTRVEAVQRQLGVTPSNLYKIKSPFEKLEIADLYKARAATTSPSWQSFLDSCLEVGSAASLKACTAKERKSYMGLLRSAKVWWWDPAFMWKGHEAAQEVLQPDANLQTQSAAASLYHEGAHLMANAA